MSEPITRNDSQFTKVWIFASIVVFIVIFVNIFSAMGAPKPPTLTYKELTSFEVGQEIPSSMYITGDYYYFVGFSPENEKIALIQKESLYRYKATTIMLYLNCEPNSVIYIGSARYTYMDRYLNNNGIIMLYEGDFIYPKGEVSKDD